MRNISDFVLAHIGNVQGIEPVNIVRVWWTTSGYIDYADREFEADAVKGSLLSLSDLEDVINLDQNSSSATLSVRLDDADGDLKEIFDNVDIHRKRIQIFQWFTEIPYDTKFVIFEGEIASPVTWNEADRTLEFDVLSKLEDREVGFSADEASFEYVPPDIVGKPWPLVFGVVNAIPAIQVNKAPTGLTLNETGTVDEKTYDLVSGYNNKNTAAFYSLFQYYWLLAIQAYATASKYEGQAIIDRQDGLNTDYTAIIEQFEQMGDDFVETANQYLREYYDLLNGTPSERENLKEKKRIETNSIGVANASAFPQGSIAKYKVNGVEYTGYFDRGKFNITKRAVVGTDDYVPAGLTQVTEKTGFTKYETQIPPDSFIYAQGGSDLRVATNYPITYIACIGHGQILGVQAYLAGILTGVPPNYYTVEHRTTNGFRYTVVVMKQPLSSVSTDWNDEIYLTIQGEVGNSMIDVMVWLIQTYTPYTYDPDSFGLVRTYTDQYPVNFAVMDQPQVMTLMKEIAFQCRCSIWFNDGKFFLKYMPVESTPIETITQDDVDLGSVQVSYTNTEDLVTKFVATWKQKLSDKDSKVIFRNNIAKYGTLTREYPFYVFNDQRLVEKSAEFWTIRYSNTWKRITFKTFLHKLKIETWDTITLTGLFVANVSVNALVESSKYDSDSKKLIISCWVPVRAGEMFPYPFATPGDLPVEYIYPVLDDPNPGSPTAPNATGKLIDQAPILGPGFLGGPKRTRPRADRGRAVPIGDSYDSNFDYSVSVALDSREVQSGRPPVFSGATLKQYSTKPPQPTPFDTTEDNGIYFGEVVAKVKGKEYNVNVWLEGFGKEPKMIVVEQFRMNEEDEIPPETPVTVYQKTEAVEQNDRTLLYTRKYYMQVPVWIRPNDSE